jgi:hypothetical protein
MRRHIIRVHYNKRTKAWTIKHKGKCIPAKKVHIRAWAETELMESDRNPRAFLRAYGFLIEDKGGVYIISGNLEYLPKNLKIL